jgi:hypothetical protein
LVGQLVGYGREGVRFGRGVDWSGADGQEGGLGSMAPWWIGV